MIQGKINEEEYKELEDSHYKDMTLREYACIHLKVPATEKEWLNEIIKQATPGSKLTMDIDTLTEAMFDKNK